jgi:hypothetical protein
MCESPDSRHERSFAVAQLGHAIAVLLLDLAISLVVGVLFEIPIYVSTTRTFEGRGESLRRPVMLTAHALLALALALLCCAVVDLQQRHYHQDAPLSARTGVVLLVLGLLTGAVSNIVIQRERLRARQT